MAIVLSGSTGIDAGSLPVSNCGNTEVEGNLNLSGVGTRITGDFNNPTYSNRVAFQTNTPNSNTAIDIIPNGTSTTSGVNACNSSDISNCSTMQLQVTAVSANIASSTRGTGTYLPITIQTGGSERMRIDTAGNVNIGNTGDNNTRRLGFTTTGGGTSAIESVTIGATNQDLVFKTTYVTESEKLRITGQGDVLLKSGTGGLGYGTGAGGTVTQLTSKSTAVVLNKPTGQITMNNAALAAGASVEFYLNNSLLSSSDTLVVSGGIYSYNYTTQVKTVSSGIATIRVTNVTGGTLSEALGISFTVLKGATA